MRHDFLFFHNFKKKTGQKFGSKVAIKVETWFKVFI